MGKKKFTIHLIEKRSKQKNVYPVVSNIVCFFTFSVKRKENYLQKIYIFAGPCGKCIFSYNFTDITKLMILFYLQRLGAECKVPGFLNF